MKSLLTISIIYFLSIPLLFSQQLYFPPVSGVDWAEVDTDSLGWCQEKIDSLIQFLDDKDSKSFIILKNGKIAVEVYFDDFTQDSNWYFASASKTVMALLTGIAQQQGVLDIHDPVSDYLGEGWTQAPPDKEALITLWHQLTMTMGLDDAYADPTDCKSDTCFQYLADAGTIFESYGIHRSDLFSYGV